MHMGCPTAWKLFGAAHTTLSTPLTLTQGCLEISAMARDPPAALQMSGVHGDPNVHGKQSHCPTPGGDTKQRTHVLLWGNLPFA